MGGRTFSEEREEAQIHHDGTTLGKRSSACFGAQWLLPAFSSGNQVTQQVTKEVWCILKSLFLKGKEGKSVDTEEPSRCLRGTSLHSIGGKIRAS